MPPLQKAKEVLEEDQFEEFEVEGGSDNTASQAWEASWQVCFVSQPGSCCPDWSQQQAGAVGDAALWESAWDDDNLDDDFAAQLRAQQQAAKQAQKTSG